MAFAQPQAPVIWENPRWMGLGEEGRSVHQVITLGDTLIFSSYTYLGGGAQAWTSYSYDNGFTHSGWQLMHDADQDGFYIHLSGSGCRSISSLTHSNGDFPWQSWMRRSLDGGNSWSNPFGQRIGGYLRSFMAGDLAFRLRIALVGSVRETRFSRSIDGGSTWDPEITISTDTLVQSDHSLAMTANDVLVVSAPPASAELEAARGIGRGEMFSEFQSILSQPPGIIMQNYSIAADSGSDHAIVASVWQSDLTGGSQLWITRTANSGVTWEPSDSLNDAGSIRYGDVPVIFCRGKLCGVAWEEQTNGQTPNLSWRLSANHGRDWYPEQTIVLNTRWVIYTTGQFTQNAVRLFWFERVDSVASYRDVRAVTGTLQRDTLSPVLHAVSIPSDTVSIGDSLFFSIEAVDNDTISRVMVKIANGSDDTAKIPLERLDASHYATTWEVQESGHYYYWFEAEDFWENAARLPESGAFEFVTDDLSSATWMMSDAAAGNIRICPNPSNGWPALILSPAWLGPEGLRIQVFNVLGQLVSENVIVDRSGVYALGKLFVSRQSNLTTGVYFLLLESGTRTQVVRFHWLR